MENQYRGNSVRGKKLHHFGKMVNLYQLASLDSEPI